MNPKYPTPIIFNIEYFSFNYINASGILVIGTMANNKEHKKVIKDQGAKGKTP
jgi:hypothetical protein